MSKDTKKTPVVKEATGVVSENNSAAVVDTSTVAPEVTGTGDSAPAVVETSATAPEVTGTGDSSPAVVETSATAPEVTGTGDSAPAIVETIPTAPEVTGTGDSAPAVVDTNATVADATDSLEASIIPSGRFVSSNGDEFDFTVNQFAFKGKLYSKGEALSDHSDVLEHLISINSFILKKL